MRVAIISLKDGMKSSEINRDGKASLLHDCAPCLCGKLIINNRLRVSKPSIPNCMDDKHEICLKKVQYMPK